MIQSVQFDKVYKEYNLDYYYQKIRVNCIDYVTANASEH